MNTDTRILTREVFTSAGRDAVSELSKSGFSCTILTDSESEKSIFAVSLMRVIPKKGGSESILSKIQ